MESEKKTQTHTSKAVKFFIWFLTVASLFYCYMTIDSASAACDLHVRVID